MENLADCIRMWMVDYKKNSVKPSTYDRLIVSRKLLERYALAWMPTDRITVDDIQRFVNELVRDGYAWTTIKKEYSLLTAFYKFAYSRGLSSTLPYVGVELPREANVKKPRKDIDIFAPYIEFAEHSHTSSHEAMLSAGAVPAVAKSHGNHAFN